MLEVYWGELCHVTFHIFLIHTPIHPPHTHPCAHIHTHTHTHSHTLTHSRWNSISPESIPQLDSVPHHPRPAVRILETWCHHGLLGQAQGVPLCRSLRGHSPPKLLHLWKKTDHILCSKSEWITQFIIFVVALLCSL